MLTIRYLRAGRRNHAFFRIVLTDSSKPPKSGFIKVLGWYDPHRKESSLQKEDILGWLDKGAQPSNSVAKLLEDNKIKHKLIKFVKDAPGKPKKEVVEKEKTAAKEEITEEQAEAEKEVLEKIESTEEIAEESKPEKVKEESKTEEIEDK